MTPDDDDRGITNRQAFNEGWEETIEKINRDREQGTGPFSRPHPAADPTLFAAQVSRVRECMMAVENADHIPDHDDPRSLDPDDGPLEEMYAAALLLEAAASQLKSAASEEMSRRNGILDAMPDADFTKWEQAVAAKHREEA